MVNNTRRMPESIMKKIAEKNRQQAEAAQLINVSEDESKPVQNINPTDSNDRITTQAQIADGVTKNKDDLFYDPSLFQPVKSVGRASVSSGAGAVSVVRTPGNGNRLSISSQIMEALGEPEEVQVQIHDDAIAIAVEFPNPSFSYPVKRIGKKGVIYSASLIREIAEELTLDLSGRTTVTLYRYKVINVEENVVVVVKK
ncbi:MAG: hypothetical protein AB9835_01895 [Eubacteriales bacterium]